jgi:hypothetical protein
VGAITRLADLGVPSYLIAATVIGVLAQRLTRTLCPACKVRDDGTTRDALDELAKPWRLSGGVRPYKPVGCLECRHTGYRGRAGLYELLVMTEAARDCVHPALDAGAAPPGGQGRHAPAAPGRCHEGGRRRDHHRRGAAKHTEPGRRPRARPRCAGVTWKPQREPGGAP